MSDNDKELKELQLKVRDLEEANKYYRLALLLHKDDPVVVGILERFRGR